AMEAGLAICRQKPLINSASGTQESKEKMLPLAQKYGSNVVISVLNDAGIPSDAASRAESIMETIDYANIMGIPNEDIWVDPIMMPIGVSQSDVLEVIEFVGMLPCFPFKRMEGQRVLSGDNNLFPFLTQHQFLNLARVFFQKFFHYTFRLPKC
ncbi:5-methyltetrahydrofolate corrinoid/iron sulfur protein methyltransferase, partial [Candidatus Hakubella thermalkaliphila]